MGLNDFDDLELHVNSLPGSHYGFSAAKIETLTAPEYTLVTIAVDDSGSVENFRSGLEQCVRNIILSLRSHPRSDYLLIRVVSFSTRMKEVIGFTLLGDIKLADLNDFLGEGGGTYLFGAVKNAVDASNAYAKELFDNEYKVNGLVYVLTDGDDNSSSRDNITASMVGESLKYATQSEAMESFISILVGVDIKNSVIKKYLDDFSTIAKFNKFVSLDNADEKALTRIADLASQSISLQSQAIGSGGPSQAIQSLTI